MTSQKRLIVPCFIPMVEIESFQHAVSLAGAAASLLVNERIHESEEVSSQVVAEDLVICFQWLHEHGHGQLMSVIMETVEQSTWWNSPEEDQQEHSRLCGDVFESVPALAQQSADAPEESPEASYLEQCFSLTE